MTDQNQESTGGNVAADISARLSGQEAQGTQAPTNEPRAATPTPFDLTKLSHDQLQQLKAMLNSTPDRVAHKQVNPTIKLRSISGNIVVDIGNAYLALVRDPENNRDVERHKIPVKFLGAEKFTDVLYKDFMQAEQIVCEVIKTNRKEEPVVEGQVFSKERGTMVEMTYKVAHDFFTIKLPDGREIEVEGKVVNA